MGPDSYTNYDNLLTCAESGGSSDGTIILDPGPGYAVDSTPLMDSSGKCDPNVDYSRTSPSSSGGGTGNSTTDSSSQDSSTAQQASGSTVTTLATTTTSEDGSGPGATTTTSGKTQPTGKSGEGKSTDGGSTGSCDWEGHCKGASCQTYNDCGDPFSCINGKCT